MKRRFRCPVEAKKEYVVEVLSGLRTEVVARKYGMSPKTLTTWVRQYEDEVGELVAKNKRNATNTARHDQLSRITGEIR